MSEESATGAEPGEQRLDGLNSSPHSLRGRLSIDASIRQARGRSCVAQLGPSKPTRRRRRAEVGPGHWTSIV